MIKLINKYFKKIIVLKDAKNILLLSGSTVIAQLITILVLPFLTRIYSPESFGLLSFFSSIILILGNVSAGRYENAIMLPDDEEDAQNLFIGALLYLAVFSIIIFLGFSLFNNQISAFLKSSEISFWLYFIPLFIFLYGLFLLFTNLANRKLEYKSIALNQILQNASAALVKIVLGLIKFLNSGLIIGQAFTYVTGNLYYIKKYFINENIFKSYSKNKLVNNLKRYKKFPLISSWSIFLNSLSRYVVNLIVPSVYSTYELGQFSLSQKLLGMPSTIIGQSVARVFFQKSNEEKKSTGQSSQIFRTTFLQLAVISVPIFCCVYFLVEPTFTFFFGEKWIDSAKYAKVLIPMFCIRFIASPLTRVLIVFEKYYYELFLQIILVAASVVTAYLSKVNSYDILHYLKLYSYSLIFVYSIAIILLYRVSYNK